MSPGAQEALELPRNQVSDSRTHADYYAAEFRGPGTHHRFDDSPDDYDMDMDQRTRFLGGRAGRIILLGDGTEILTGHVHDDDGDVDMEDRGEAEEAEDDDISEQVQKGEDTKAPNGELLDAERSKREETPSPALEGKNTESEDKVSEVKQQESEDREKANNVALAVDGTESNSAAEGKDKK